MKMQLATALLLSLPLVIAAPARAQETAIEVSADEEADFAFLRAYYLEKGLQDFAAAEKAYADVARDFTRVRDVVAKALLGRLRCLNALQRGEDAGAALAHLTKEFADRPQLLVEARAVFSPTKSGTGPDVATLVERELVRDTWKANLPNFGAHGVPALASSLRVAEPSYVYRAAFALTRIASDAACDELAAALHDDAVLYPGKVFDGIFLVSRPIPDRLGRAVMRSPDRALAQRFLARSLLGTYRQAWIVEAVLEHEWAREVVFPAERSDERGRAAVFDAVCAAGPGPARDAALRYLRLHDESPGGGEWYFAFYPSEGLLADREALALLCRNVYPHVTNIQPSDALRDTLLRDSDLRKYAVKWVWRWGSKMRTPPPRDALLDALAAGHWGLDLQSSGRKVDPVRGLYVALRPPLTADEMRRLAPNWAKDESLAGYIDSLRSVGKLDLDIVFAALETQDHPESEARLINFLRAWGGEEDPSRLAAAYIGSLESPSAHPHAFNGLTELQSKEGVDLSAATPTLVRMLRSDENRDWTIRRVELLFAIGEQGRRALAESVQPGLRWAPKAMELLLRHDAPETRAAARRLIASRPEEFDGQTAEELRGAANVLARLEGPAASDELAAAMRAGPALRLSSILQGAATSSYRLGGEGFAQLLEIALDPGWEEIAFNNQTMNTATQLIEMPRRRELVRKGLASPHFRALRWATYHSAQVRDPGASEMLGALTASTDPIVIRNARNALAALRKVEWERVWIERAAARRRTLEQVDALLESAEPRRRMAGVAGLVALGAPDALDRLLAIAVNDADAEVAAEARRALMALGKPIPDLGPKPSSK